MTRETEMEKTRLAAFADGELTPEEAAAVVMHLADHPQDQAYVDDLMAANAALARAFAAPMAEPVPAAIMAALQPDGTGTARVIPFHRRAGLRFAAAGLALAATMAAAVVLLQPATGPELIAAGAVAEGSALHGILSAAASGTPLPFGSGELTVLTSMPAADGFCRELELIDRQADRLQVALACGSDAGWTVDVVLAETIPHEEAIAGFSPASGADVALLDRWLNQRGAGLALTAAEETEAIRKGWAP